MPFKRSCVILLVILASACSGSPTSTTTTTPTPTLSALSPVTGVQGATVPVTLTGTNFIVGGTTVVVSGTGVTVTGVSASTTTSATATFQIAATAPVGPYNVTVTTSGGTSNTQTFTLTASGTVNVQPQPTIGSFTASPSAITVGGSTTLTWSGITNATSCSINNGVGAISCGNANTVVSPAASATYTLTVTGAGGSTTATAIVTVNAAPATPATRIISVSGNLAFGNVTVGQTASAIFTITNSGNSTLTVSGMTAPVGSAGVYSVSWGSGTIPAGGAQQVTQFFTPLAAQSYNGLITVNGDQTSGTNTIAVSGTGVTSSTPTPTPSGGYSITASATCTQQAGKNSNGDYLFTIVESGTATAADVGAFFDIGIVQLLDFTNPYLVTCSTWTPEDVTCRRGSGQPTTTNWTATVQNVNTNTTTTTLDVGVNLLDSTGTSRQVLRPTVTCTAK